MLIYEQIEEMGVETFLNLSPDRRDSFLYRTPSDELMCFFMFMTCDEFISCFSKEIIYKRFMTLPPQELLVLCQEVGNQLPTFLSKGAFRSKWSHMLISTVLDDWERMPNVIQWLLDQEYIHLHELRMMVSEASIYSWMNWYPIHSTFTKVLEPLISPLFTTIPLQPGVKEHVMSFLFTPYSKK